jgi:heptosyltransferase II
MTSLVIQTSFLGDMVLTTPLLAFLAESGPVDVVATPPAATLLANHPAVRRVIPYDKRGSERGTLGFVRLAMRLRGERYQAAYLAQGSVRSGALAMVAGIPKRVGFDSSAGRTFYTHRLPYMEDDHHTRRLLSLAGGADAATGERLRPRLYPGQVERAAVDGLLEGVGPSTTLFALAPGSIWATKRWPRFVELAADLSRRGTIVTIGSAGDRDLAAAIDSAVDGRAIDATGKLTLLASAELIGRSRVLVTNDSAPQHLASAMNTPTVAIFGPTVPAFGFGPLAHQSTVIGLDTLACRPCDRHGPVSCPLGHWKCMRDIAVPSVVEAVDTLIG